MSAVNPTADRSIKEFLQVLALRVGRAVLTFLMSGLVIVAGVSIPALVSSKVAPLQAAGLAFGATTVLAVLKDLLQTLPTAFEYIMLGVTKSLPKLFVEIGVAALGLGFVWYAVQAPPTVSSERSLQLNVAGSLPPIVLNESGAVFATYLTFGEWDSALKEGDPQLALVNSLIQSLAQCVQTDRDTIELVVRAYASSSGPDKRNEKLYKDRGAYVEGLLKQRIGELAPEQAAQFIVEVREWRSLEAMKLRRLFKDTNDKGAYLSNAAALNRRADILVRSAGSCLSS